MTEVLKNRMHYFFRGTQTDESDMEGDIKASESSEPPIQDQLEALKLELLQKT